MSNNERKICLQKRLKQSKSAFIILVVVIIIITSTAFATSKADQTKNELTYIAIGDSITEGLLENGTFSETGVYYDHFVNALFVNDYSIDYYNFTINVATSSADMVHTMTLTNTQHGVD